MNSIKSLLFGAVQSIEIHSLSQQTGDRLRYGVLATLGAMGRAVPVSI
jgi:hypothetical protein